MTLRQIAIGIAALGAMGLVLFLLYRRYGHLMPEYPTMILGAAIALALAARWWGRNL